jgi:hypothetical protein
MQHYLNQLINDLQAAKKNALPEPGFGTTYEEFEETMLEIENASYVEPKNIFGVSYEELPPPEKLSGQEMQLLLDAILDTWESFGISASIPDEAPIHVQYEVVRDCFAEKLQPVHGLVFDFCTGWCPDCKLCDYCPSVKEIWTDEELRKAREG